MANLFTLPTNHGWFLNPIFPSMQKWILNFLLFLFSFTFSNQARSAKLDGSEIHCDTFYSFRNTISIQDYLTLRNIPQKLHQLNYLGKEDCERWIEYSFELAENQCSNTLVIDLPDPLADVIEVYILSPDGKISLIGKSGDELQLSKNIYPLRTPIALVKSPQKGKYTAYIRYIRSGNYPHLTFKIWELSAFLLYYSRIEYFFGFIYGIFFLYFVFTLFLGIKNKSLAFFTFSLWILSNISFFVLSSGHMKFFIYPNTEHLNSILRMYLMFITPITLMEFLVDYLNIKPQTKWLRRFIQIMFVLATIMFAYLLLYPHNNIEKTKNTAVIVIQSVFFIMVLLIICIPIIHYKTHKKFSFLYLIIIFNTANALIFLFVSISPRSINYNEVIFWLLILPLLEITAIAVALTERILSSFRTTNTLLETNLNLQLEANNIQTKAVELERKRIAMELHDDILNRLSILLMLNSAGETTNEIIETTLSGINKDIRNYAYRLYPPWIEDLSFTEMVNRELKAMATSFDIEINHQIYDLKHEFTPFQKINVFRILQEFLQNSKKHGNAKNVSIDIYERDGYVDIYLEDNGVGFDTTTVLSGIGMNSVKSRVNMLGGQISINSELGKSVSWMISFPLKFKNPENFTQFKK